MLVYHVPDLQVPHHYATLVVAYQFAKPWIGPVVRHFVEAMLSHIIAKASGALIRLPSLLHHAITRVSKMASSVASNVGQRLTAVNATINATDKIVSQPVVAAIENAP